MPPDTSPEMQAPEQPCNRPAAQACQFFYSDTAHLAVSPGQRREGEQVVGLDDALGPAASKTEIECSLPYTCGLASAHLLHADGSQAREACQDKSL